MTAQRIACAALLSMVLLSGCGRDEEHGWQGYVEAEYTYIAALESGRITALAVERGDQVTEGQPLFALEDAVVKLALFAPVGAAVGNSRSGALAGGLAALAVEAGQLFLPAHVPGASDVVLGVLGGAAGGWATHRVLGERPA